MDLAGSLSAARTVEEALVTYCFCGGVGVGEMYDVRMKISENEKEMICSPDRKLHGAGLIQIGNSIPSPPHARRNNEADLIVTLQVKLLSKHHGIISPQEKMQRIRKK